MSKPWTAEHFVDQKLAKILIEEQFPRLAPAQLVFIGEGWDNRVYRVNDQFLFRFPRRQFGANLVPIERSVLPYLANRLPLPIPEPLFFGQPTVTYPWPFLGYNFLTGQSACSAQLDRAERARLAPSLAQFLKILHNTPLDDVLGLGLDYDKHRILDVPFRVPTARENILKIKNLGLFTSCDKLLAIIDKLEHVRDHEPKVVVHGDLYARHLLIGEQRELAGVIDWGDLRIVNPAIDLAIVFTFLPPEAHATFFEVYGPVPQETKQLACLKGLYHNAIILCYAHEIGDQELLTEAQMAMALIAEVKIIS